MEDQTTTRGMEQLLKQVYAVHKNTLKGVNSNLLKYKTAYIKAVEKCNQLQKKNEELECENRKLSTAITTKQNRDGSCCEVIRQSLDTVISSYKQMLADKDARIAHLEEELNSHKRNSLAGNSKVRYESNVAVANSSPGHVNQNPDSTSCVTPVSIQRQDTGQGSSCVTPEVEDLVFDTTADDENVKLKLNRKRSKRSRYSEDISPESKKQRKSSPTSQSCKTGDGTVAKVSVRSVEENEEKEARLNKQRNNRKIEKVNKDSGKLCKGKQKVLVADTCVPDLNESLVSKGFTVKDKEQLIERQAAGNKDYDTNVLVVPETLAIDMDDEVAPEDVSDKADGVDGKFRHKLTDIIEDCEDSTLSESENKHDNSNENKVEKKGDSRKEKFKDFPLSFRSILNSSGSESSDEKQEHLEELDLDSCSLAKDSDNDDGDTFFESLPNSQTFSRSKMAGTSINDASLDTSRKVRNTCKNMKEVNALFETPESKDSLKETSSKGNQNIATKKPLFRKGKMANLKDEVQSKIVLRRSPRKHKQTTIRNNLMRTPTKARTKLNNEKVRTSPKFSRHRIRDNEVTEEAGDYVTEADLTIAPDHVDNSSTEHTVENETETVDCYNVMPVQDGNIDPTRKFQVKVKGIKKPKRILPETDALESETAQAVNIHNETLKSPSILDQDGRSRIGAFSGVIRINSSRSASNDNDVKNSDIESPLIIKTDKYREQIDDDLEIVDWNSAKAHKKSSSSNSLSSSLSTRRNNLRSSQQSEQFRKPDTIHKSGKGKQKNVHQTTLTQGFFSPKKNMVDKNDDVEESCDNTVEDRNKQTPDFKSPRKSRFGRQRANKPDNANIATGQRETTEVPASAGVLVEVRDQSGNVGGGRLNGSLDPSAELSEWCKDPETVPSLDTDFCEADLQAGINSLPRTSTLAEEDTQDIPCSSTSYKFLPKRQRNKDEENIDPKKTVINLDDSFDRLPRKQGPDVAHVAVVRKRDERQKLQGHSCKECLQYYTSAGRSDEEIKQHMQQCSRHRAQFVPPDTPPHFWSIGFIETQEPNESGTKEEVDIDLDVGGEQDAPTYRRRKRLNKYFKSKNERTFIEEDSQNSQQYAV